MPFTEHQLQQLRRGEGLMAERFTPFFEWSAESKDLTLAEALVLCRIKMWGGAGCFEKYSTLARKLKLGKRTVIRSVLSLRRKGLIKVSYKDAAHQKRVLIFNFERTGLPIIDQKPVPVRHRNTAREAKTCASQAQVPVPGRHHTISCTKPRQDIDETTSLLGELLTTQKKPLRGQAFEAKRQKLTADLMRADKDSKKER